LWDPLCDKIHYIQMILTRQKYWIEFNLHMSQQMDVVGFLKLLILDIFFNGYLDLGF